MIPSANSKSAFCLLKNHVVRRTTCNNCPEYKKCYTEEQNKMETKTKFCEMFDTEKEAKKACACDCETPHNYNSTYCHCAYGNCCGYKCNNCGKFEVVSNGN